MKYHLVFLPVVILLSACNGGSGGGGAGKNRNTVTPIKIDIDAHIDGQYQAIFETLNHQITSKVTGAFTFSREIEIDELVADVRIANGGPKLIHSQNIRLGHRCPTMDDDLNHDGIIDAREGEAVYGKIFIPLDGDISSQSSHDGEFPMGDIYGNYIYSKVTKFTTFISDLHAKDFEGYVKLKDKEPLNIEGRAVVVHGVDEAAGLPASVASVGRAASHQSLPIVCGVITKVLNPPGEIDDGTIHEESETSINENLIQP